MVIEKGVEGRKGFERFVLLIVSVSWSKVFDASFSKKWIKMFEWLMSSQLLQYYSILSYLQL